MNFIKSILVSALSLQMAFLPLAFSMKSAVAVADDTDPVVEQAKSMVQNTESQGWTFLDANKNPIKALDLAVDLAKNATGAAVEIYALSSNIQELNTKLGVKITLAQPSAKEYSYKIVFMDKDFKNTITGRKISFKSSASKEENAVKFQRSLKAMEAEILNHKSELTQNAKPGVLNRVLNAVVPSAYANADAKAEQYQSSLAANLMVVAQGASTIGVLILFFGGYFSSGKTRIALTILPFAVAVIAYVVSGIAEDNAKKATQK